MRIVPDYLSLFPQAKETAPYAGASRPLCDRKEVLLNNQMAADARFFIFTSTHIASKYTGVITDDFTSEFDPVRSNVWRRSSRRPTCRFRPGIISGTKSLRVYSDHWGIFDGLTYSSWKSMWNSAQHHRVFADDDGAVHERSGSDPGHADADSESFESGHLYHQPDLRAGDSGSSVQPSVQRFLLRAAVYAGA